MSVAAEDTTLEITHLFNAPPARVFNAWLNREEWQAWIGPEGINCDVPLLEPRVGGRYRITMRLSDGREVIDTDRCRNAEPSFRRSIFKCP